MKNKKPIIIVLGEPNSIFTEILCKVLNKQSIKKRVKFPIILIGSERLIISQLKILKKKLSYELLDLNLEDLSNKNFLSRVYLIDVDYNFKKPFELISGKSKKYISNCFKYGVHLLNKGISDVIVNGPISKRFFLDKKYPGITEYIFHKSNKKISKNPVMLLFNNNLSVSPITTHIPLKNVSKKINKKVIYNNVLTINNFYKNFLKIKPKIAILGLNPHCETKSSFNEELKIIIPAIKNLKKEKININGPFPADTFFLKENLYKFNSIIGMYHDQILTPFKTLYGFNASNITLGLPFLRLSVDHGPNQSMMGKNKSNPQSLENIFNFIISIK